MQCDICSEKESGKVIEMIRIESINSPQAKSFACPECGSLVYISFIFKNKQYKQNNQNELNNFA